MPVATTEILSVGTTFGISATSPATYDATGFAALTFVTVGEIESIGEIGPKATVTEFTPLASGVVIKRKGSINYGEAAIVFADIPGDTGQIAMQSGMDGANKNTVHSFMMTNQDGRKVYGQCVVNAFSLTTGSANDIRKANASVAITGALVKV